MLGDIRNSVFIPFMFRKSSQYILSWAKKFRRESSLEFLAICSTLGDKTKLSILFHQDFFPKKPRQSKASAFRTNTCTKNKALVFLTISRQPEFLIAKFSFLYIAQ